MSTFEWITTLLSCIGFVGMMWIHIDKKLSAIYDELKGKVSKEDCLCDMMGVTSRIDRLESYVYSTQKKTTNPKK